MFGKTFDRARLDSLTLGLERNTARNIHRLPLAIVRLRRIRRRTAQFFGTYDVVLTPTLADETPRIGYLAPTDYHQVIERLIDWVSFTRCRTSPASRRSHSRWRSPMKACRWA